MNDTLQSIYTAVLGGKLEDSCALCAKALEEGIAPKSVVDDAMIVAMTEIGRRFESQEAFVPELLMAGRAMKGAIEILKPHMLEGEASEKLGTIVIGTVEGDLHDIGKNLVATMLENCGFEVINLGVNISSAAFIDAIKKYDANILCMSALLTTTMVHMETVIKDLERNELRDKVKVMIGGAPLSDSFAEQIGADGFSENANAAVALAKLLIPAN